MSEYVHFLIEEMEEWRHFLDPNYKYKSIVFRYSIIFNNFPTLFKYGISFVTIFAFVPLLALAILRIAGFLSIQTFAWSALTIQISFTTMLTIVSTITFSTLLKYNDDKYHFNKQAKFAVLSASTNISSISIWAIISADPLFLALSMCWTLGTIPLLDWLCNILYPIYLIKEETKKINTVTRVGSGSSSVGIHGKTNIMIEILCDSIGFETFMNHLRSEFAAENLLFVVYLIQFQNFLIEYGQKQGKQFFDDSDTNNKPFISKDWKLPGNVPKCGIFEMHDYNKNKKKNTDASKDGKIMFGVVDVIYKTFVEKQRATLEVNISGRNRAQISHFYNKMNSQLEQDDYDYDDDVGKMKNMWQSLRVAGLECWQLMSHTLGRYQLPDSLA